MVWFKKIKTIFVNLSEGIAAAMLAALFFTFVLQVFSRYVLRSPLGWTVEVCLTLWVWLVLWGNSFILKHDHHVVFDLLYHKFRKKVRMLLSLISFLSILIGFIYSFYPTWDFISFLEIRNSYVLRIPMDKVFIIYMVFLISVIATYAWHLLRLIKDQKLPHEDLKDKIEGDMS